MPGVRRASSSHTATYSSYGVTMKQVWVNWADLRADPVAPPAARRCPTETTAMPEPKSISELPSASTSTPPPAAVDEYGQHVADAAGHGALPALQQFA